MTKRYFANIDPSNQKVVRVDVWEGTAPSYPASETWIETWKDANGSESLRWNYAGIGGTYWPELDAFIPPNPGTSTSRVLNTETMIWDPPSNPPATNSDLYFWDDDYCAWITRVGPGNNGGIDNARIILEGFPTSPNGTGSTVAYGSSLFNVSGNVVGYAYSPSS